MYEVFDGFMEHETWYAGHDLDKARFYTALSKVVSFENFHADNMGHYMREKIGAASIPTFDNAIDGLVSDAHAIREYLKLGL